MTGPQRVRATVDKLNKRKAMRPPMPTGGVERMQAEAVNTSANARGLAKMATRKPQRPEGTKSLAEEIRKARKSY